MSEREEIIKSRDIEKNYNYLMTNAKTLTQQEIDEHKSVLFNQLSESSIFYINMEVERLRHESNQDFEK